MQCWVFKLQTRRYKMNDEWVNIQLKKDINLVEEKSWF